MWGKIFFLWMRNHRLSVEKAACFSTRRRGKSVSRTMPLCEGLQMWIPSWWTTTAVAAGEGQPTPAANLEFLEWVPGIAPAPGRIPCSLLPPLRRGEPQCRRWWGGLTASWFQAISGILQQLWCQRGNGSGFLPLWNFACFFRKNSHSTWAKPSTFKVWRKLQDCKWLQGGDVALGAGLRFQSVAWAETSNLCLHALYSQKGLLMPKDDWGEYLSDTNRAQLIGMFSTIWFQTKESKILVLIPLYRG